MLIAHQWLYSWAGAERCLEQMLEVFPGADLLVGVMTPSMRGLNGVTRRARESWVGRVPGARAQHRWFVPLHALAFARHDTSRYDLVISSSHAFEKFIHWRRGPAHVCYCYSPPRFLWGMAEAYEARAGLLERAALNAGSTPWRVLDRRAARRVDGFIAISRYIADRVRRAYDVGSGVVYPPVAAKPVGSLPRSAPSEPFVLTIGRLVEYKRIDLLVLAAEHAGIRLVVAGDGPERRRLEAIAGPRTTFLGEVDEPTAGALLERCAAFAFAGEEDFGIALVEANAHGRPVVCYGRGGAAETMVHGETAQFFHQQTTDAIATALREAIGRHWDRDALRRNAERFSAARFRTEFSAAVTAVLEARR